MDNGCPKCEELAKKYFTQYGLDVPFEPLCLECRLKQAEADLLKAINRVEEIKAEIAEEELM